MEFNLLIFCTFHGQNSTPIPFSLLYVQCFPRSLEDAILNTAGFVFLVVKKAGKR